MDPPIFFDFREHIRGVTPLKSFDEKDTQIFSQNRQELAFEVRYTRYLKSDAGLNRADWPRMKKFYGFLVGLLPMFAFAVSPLFQSDDVLVMTLQGNFPEVNQRFASQNNSTPGEIVYKDNGVEFKLPVQLSARGGGRASWCQFTPLKVTFGGSEKTARTIFSDLRGKSLKTVTHCKNIEFVGDSSWNDAVLVEHALYQIIFSAGLPALDSRLAQVEYLDQAGQVFEKGYMLILENPGGLAARYGFEALPKGHQFQIKDTARIPWELGLQLNSSREDHNFGHSKNGIFFLDKNKELLQISYDYLLSPQFFPYSKAGKEYPQNWLKRYASKHRELGSEIDKWVTVILEHRGDILSSIEKVPFQKNSFQKVNLINWVNEFFADAESYLKSK